jgi:hypothetical protein
MEHQEVGKPERLAPKTWQWETSHLGDIFKRKSEWLWGVYKTHTFTSACPHRSPTQHKQKKSSWAGGVVQGMEHLTSKPSNHEA